MTNPTITLGDYREQLNRWARGMALARKEVVFDALAKGSLPVHVRMFVEGNLEKRFEFLKMQLAFVATAFKNFDERLEQFVAEQPLAAHCVGSTDAERFLQWLEAGQRLTRKQLDHVACQRARHAVEAEARQNRRGHLRFQEWWSVSGHLAETLGDNDRLRIHLNPIRAWSRFETTVLLDEEAKLPADVLFFPVRESISTAVLEPDGQALLHQLAAHSPWTLDEWAMVSACAGRKELTAFCRCLATLGLVAFT